jgi:cell cycle sensor histidine kinase DivJ
MHARQRLDQRQAQAGAFLGAGLGLTLVRAFAELHGGKLLVESQAGEGFKAVIVLPAG